MKSCPNCARQVEETTSRCRFCGWKLHDGAASSVVPTVVNEPAPQTTTGSAPGVPKRATVTTRSKSWRMTAMVLAFVVVGIAALMVFAFGRPPAVPEPNAMTTETGVAAAGVSAAVQSFPLAKPPPSSAPQWIGRRQRGLVASDGSRTVTFELAATDDVAVWTKRVRPVLSARCFSKGAEVFVITHSASSFERNAHEHTVHLTFDDGAEQAQQWYDSTDHEALFAPDGIALMRQIAGARRMSFRFTPFNASPVVAEFGVSGFGNHLTSAVTTCGWSGG